MRRDNDKSAVLRLRGSICHLRGFSFTNAQKIYYHLRVSIARFLITFTGKQTRTVHVTPDPIS